MLSDRNIEDQIAQLRSPNNKEAYRALKSLIDVSERSNEVYRRIETFIEMMRDSSSYVRTRGLTLIACNARWDKAGRIDEVIDAYLEHITDEKPITARQCAKLVVQLAEAKPNLLPHIISALREADVSNYPDSMRPLIQGDIRESLLALDNRL